MTPQKWDRIKEIFDAAISCQPADRAPLLTRECGDDAALRAEIERLLAYSGAESDFLEAPPIRLPGLVSKPALPLQAFAEGELISGRFRILRRIGSGGMGEVYQAEDLNLGGEIAIKTIRPEISMDPRTLARFKREIQLGRSITHPNVCRVYDIASAPAASGMDVSYLTMEMVKGETLDVLLRREGPLHHGAGLPLIRQMAAALDAAHRAGIVHRDFKPSNVIVAGSRESEQRVVVTDFGLASSTEADITGERLSVSHSILGTPAYMAPEQLKGEAATPATDIYAFGLVVYEMLTGKPAFPAAAHFSGAVARLTTQPARPRGIRPDIDSQWEKLILRCLERDPAQRFANGTELALAIEEAGGRSSGTIFPARVARRRPISWRWGAVAGVMALLVIAAGWIALRQPRLIPPISTGDAHFIQLTTGPGQELFPSFSPDGKDLVYASQSAGHWDVYRLRIGEKAPVNLTAGSGFDNTQPAFSPDGLAIAFRSERDGGGIFIMPAAGGAAKRISSVGYLPAWSPDGKRLACSTATFTLAGRGDVSSRLLIVDVETGTQQFPNLEDNAIQPSWSPHGNRIAYWRLLGGKRDICTIPADGGARVCVTGDHHVNWNPVWSPDGRYLYFASDRGGSMNLWRVPLDESTGKPTGEFVPLTTPSTYTGYLAISRDGSRMAYAQLEYSSHLQKIAFDPERQATTGTPQPITQGMRVACCPNSSPDGKWLAFGTGGGREGISIIRTDGSDERMLTMTEHRNRQPRWSPRGDLIAFTSNRSGSSEIWTIRPDGSGLRQLTAGNGASVRFCAWSPDGRHLFYDVQGDTPRIIDLDNPASAQNPAILPRPDGSNSEFRATNWSPDGSKLVGPEFRADGSPGGLLMYSVTRRSYQRLITAGSFALWLQDGRSVLFDDEGKMFVVDTVTSASHEVFSVAGGEIDDDFSVSPDQRTIYFRLAHTEADLWLLAKPSDSLITHTKEQR